MDVSTWMRLACYLLCLCNPFPPAPEKPSNIIITYYTSSLTVQWDEERDAKYIIYVQKKSSMETIVFEDVTTPYNITGPGLESNTEYTVVVEAYNSLEVPTGV